MKELLANKILTSLSAEDFANLLPRLELTSLRAGQDLCAVGGQIRYAYFPESAVISHLHILEDGHTIEASLIGKEGMTGLSELFGSCPPARWTQAVVGGSALKIEVDIISREFARSSGLRQVILTYAGARINELSQRVVCNGRHTIEERLCNWLLMVLDRAGQDLISVTHEQIASHLGTRRASVTNIANMLRDKQIITYNRGWLHVRDRETLEAIACECHRAFGAATARIENNCSFLRDTQHGQSKVALGIPRERAAD